MPIQDLDLDAIQRRTREALSFATEQVGGSEYAPESVLQHFDQDVPALINALGRAFAVIRQNAITQVNTEQKLTRARAELDAVGEMRVIEHQNGRLRVITQALHNRLCRARIATPQEEIDPNILHCAFCGFCYLRTTGGEA